jgi:SAM-dependent methyltransferase
MATNPWDQRFSEPGYKYGTQANAFLRQCANRLAPNSVVLVPGDGEGRNGVWLGAQGHTVTSVDNSAVGLQKTRELADSQGVTLTTQWADLAEWSPPVSSVDAVVLIYVHLPVSIRLQAHRALAASLRPGGWLILEAFHPTQLVHSSGGPKVPDMLVTPELLDADFAGMLQPVISWHGETTLDEGPGHQGLAHVTRWLGQRAG